MLGSLKWTVMWVNVKQYLGFESWGRLFMVLDGGLKMVDRPCDQNLSEAVFALHDTLKTLENLSLCRLFLLFLTCN